MLVVVKAEGEADWARAAVAARAMQLAAVLMMVEGRAMMPDGGCCRLPT